MICIEHLSKSFGKQQLYRDFSLMIPDGEHLAILGESGSGKTTLLRMIAGLDAPTSGRVFGYSNESVSLMFQEARLFPQLTALENVFAVIHGDKHLLRRQAVALLSELGLSEATNKYPSELSGGMCQRVALARTFLPENPIVLLDEPFSALDDATREIAHRFVEIHAAGKTLLLVTHLPADAKFLCEKTIVLSGES